VASTYPAADEQSHPGTFFVPGTVDHDGGEHGQGGFRSDYQLPHDLAQSGIEPQFVFRKPLPDMTILLRAVTGLLQ